MSQGAMSLQQFLNQVQILFQTGRHAEAAAGLRSAISQSPDMAVLHALLAQAQEAMQYPSKAIIAINSALRLEPDNPGFHLVRGRLQMILSDVDAALASFDRVLELKPGDPETIGMKAEWLGIAQRFDEARDCMAPGLAEDPPVPEIVLAHAKMAERLDEEARSMELLNRTIEDPRVPMARRGHYHMQLGRLLDRAGRYEEAFEQFASGNAMLRESYDRAEVDRDVDLMIQAWSKNTYSKLARSGINSERPIFIVGVPRSGTTLVEQILSSHSQVSGVGEWRQLPDVVLHLFRTVRARREDEWRFITRFNERHLRDAARSYLSAGREIDDQAKRLTDKMLANFKHLGMISLMMPNARVIACWRDPYDTCLSCYFQNFAAGVTYSRDLGDAAHHYTIVRRLMAHWEDLIPNPILNVTYEDLVADQENETRRLIKFAGLPWEDRCLEPHRNARITNTASSQQIRRPVYKTAVRRHERYAAHLGPIQEVLQAAGMDPKSSE
ncbi:MAG: sulfotransferase [Phycisphaerales bacterium]